MSDGLIIGLFRYINSFPPEKWFAGHWTGRDFSAWGETPGTSHMLFGPLWPTSKLLEAGRMPNTSVVRPVVMG